MKKNDTTYANISSELKRYLKKEMQVLELACGTGQISYRSFQNVQKWIATDYSPNMIAEAKKNGVKDNLQFEVADATNLRYAEGTFDIVVIANALHIMPEPQKALKEISRVLKEDGILFAPTFVYEQGYNKLLIWLMEKVGFHTYHKWTKSEYIKYITDNGFIEVDIKLFNGKPLKECVYVGVKR